MDPSEELRPRSKYSTGGKVVAPGAPGTPDVRTGQEPEDHKRRQQGGNILYQRIPTPRPAPKIVLKDALQVEQGKQSSSERSPGEENLFIIDLRVQRVPQTAVLEHQGRTTMIRELVETTRTEYQTESVIADLSKTREFNRFSEASKKT